MKKALLNEIIENVNFDLSKIDKLSLLDDNYNKETLYQLRKAKDAINIGIQLIKLIDKK
tara:strand:+ start:2204 stop:2380 length:177 start_codon:yes stop_codon:yes gene_type:complete